MKKAYDFFMSTKIKNQVKIRRFAQKTSLFALLFVPFYSVTTGFFFLDTSISR